MNYKLQHIHQLSDTITPVSVYMALRTVFCDCQLLESAEYGKAKNSSSLIGFGLLKSLQVKNNQISIYKKSTTELFQVENLVEQLNDFLSGIQTETDFNGIYKAPFVFSFFSYDSVNYFEELEISEKESNLSLPDVSLQFFEYYIRFNHFTNSVDLFQYVHKDAEFTLTDISEMIYRRVVPQEVFSVKGEEISVDTEGEFISSVRKGIKHCAIGNVFQVVLSRKFSQQYSGDEFQVYRQLRHVNPSPYMFFLDFGNFKLLGSSPETHLQIKDNRISIHPIAGTVKRKTEAENYLNIQHLLNDPKENAEHDMLIDLARNDIGIFGRNVEVATRKELQEFSHVFHLVSKVEADLIGGQNIFEIFGRSFPAGTLSGAPKYKAMQIINELEPHQRNYYGGAVGFIDSETNLTLAIMIRTICAKNNELTYMAGAGITINSKPENELQEVNNKINALRLAISKAHIENN